jgi:hypothetical protein
MTLQQLIDRLAHDPTLPRNAEIGFATGPQTDWRLASVYCAPDGRVWIDLEPD